jgi:hypothetical protein
VKLGKEFINRTIPEEFVNLVTCFYGDFQTVEEFWKMVKIAERKAGYKVTDFDLLDVSLDALKETVKALKIKKVRKNVFAYFYGTIQKMFKELYYEFYVPEEPFFAMKLPVLSDQFASPEELDLLGVF